MWTLILITAFHGDLYAHDVGQFETQKSCHIQMNANQDNFGADESLVCVKLLRGING